jgi:TolA-binding protein
MLKPVLHGDTIRMEQTVVDKKETSKRLTRAKPAIRRASSARQQLSNLLHTVESLTTRIPDLERKLATGDGIVDVAHRSRLIQELAKCRAALAEQSSRVEGTQQAAEEAQAEVDKAFADDPDADDSASGGAS